MPEVAREESYFRFFLLFSTIALDFLIIFLTFAKLTKTYHPSPNTQNISPMKTKRIYLLSLLLTAVFQCCSILEASAQTNSFKQSFTVREGLPANSITAVKQDPTGLIWVATWNGLCCYDGYQFTNLRGEPWGNDNALSTYRISSIHPDSNGNIWVKTYDNGLYLLDTEQCKYHNVKLMLTEKFGIDIAIRNIYTLPNGHTWIADEEGLLSLRIDDKQPLNIDNYEVWGKKGKALKGSLIHKVSVDAKGHEWVITDKGMMRYGTNEFRSGDFTSLNLEKEAGTAQTQQYIADNAIGKHFIDQQGNIWYWSSMGLSLVRFYNNLLQQTVIEEGMQVRSLLARHDGTVWAGGYNGNLVLFNENQNENQNAFSFRGGFPLNTQRIYALFEDREHRIWVGTRGNGLFMISPDGKSIAHYQHDDADKYSLSADEIYDIDQDGKGNIWIASYGGGVNVVAASHLPDGDAQVRFLHHGNELKGYPKEKFEKVRRITHTSNGIILAATTEGLLTIDANQGNHSEGKGVTFFTTCHEAEDTTSLQTNDVMQVLVTRSGEIFVATMGGGIQKIVSDNLLQNHLKLQSAAGMNEGSGNALSMTEDLQGNIWITRESEINRYNRKTGLLERFEPLTTDKPVIMTEAKTIIDAHGALWVATNDGIITFKPEEMKKSAFKPNIIFTSLQYQGEQQQQPLIHCRQLNIEKPSQRNLTINFAALDYNDNYLIRYAYRIDDGDWSEIGSNSRITFNQLPPGQHSLVVKSTNADGIWVDNETELIINVEPTFFERTSVRLFLLLLVIGLATWAVMTYLRHRQNVRQREQRLEHVLRQYSELQEKLIIANANANLNANDNLNDNQNETAAIPSDGTQDGFLYKLDEPEIVNPDEEMMDKLMKFIEQHISDENLKIDDMADAVSLGRSVFYGKIKSLVGVSPSDFLRQIRMERAQHLIVKSKYSFSEIAYACGFSDPKYFSKCFKKETGMTPTEYRTKKEL